MCWMNVLDECVFHHGANLQHSTTSSNYSYRKRDYAGRGTSNIIRSFPFTKPDWAETAEMDATADMWDEVEQTRLIYMHLQNHYEGRLLMMEEGEGSKSERSQELDTARLGSVFF